MVDSGNEGCPGGTLVPAVDVRHFQFCTKRHRYHARRFQSFTCFTRALHAADHFLRLRSASLTQETPPCGTGACRRGAGFASLRGGCAFFTLSCRLSSLAIAATVRLLSGNMRLALYAPPVEWVVLQEWSFPRIAAQILSLLVDMTTNGAGASRDS